MQDENISFESINNILKIAYNSVERTLWNKSGIILNDIVVTSKIVIYVFNYLFYLGVVCSCKKYYSTTGKNKVLYTSGELEE